MCLRLRLQHFEQLIYLKRRIRIVFFRSYTLTGQLVVSCTTEEYSKTRVCHIANANADAQCDEDLNLICSPDIQCQTRRCQHEGLPIPPWFEKVKE